MFYDQREEALPARLPVDTERASAAFHRRNAAELCD